MGLFKTEKDKDDFYQRSKYYKKVQRLIMKKEELKSCRNQFVGISQAFQGLFGYIQQNSC
jgi:hypothetical protein